MTDSPARPVERYGRLVALGIVAVGLILRARGAAEYWLNADEGIYYSTLTWPSFQAFWREVLTNAHPPAFYLLLRGLGYLTWDFVWLRGISVVAGAATIWILWRVGRRLGGEGIPGVVAGLVGAGLVAFNPNAVVLSQVIRPYALLVLLLAGGLLSLLRYRVRRDDRSLMAYAALLSLAQLTHYSAVLGLAVLSVLLAHDLVAGRVRGRAAARALTAHAVPAVVFGALYLLHVRPALDSALMAEALGQGGWLGGWLIDSPGAAWNSLVAFQEFHLSAAFQVRVAIVLLIAIVLSAATDDRTVAFLAGSALGVAILASAAGLYPFGETRHNAWLMVFTIPALGWLAGRLASTPRRALTGAAALLLLVVGGGPLESALGPTRAAMPVPTTAAGRRAAELDRANPMEEQVLRASELGPLIVQRMDPEGEPNTIVMTDQPYNVLMPLYPGERDDLELSADSTLFRFSYGSREIVVFRTWDWGSMEDLARGLDGIPGSLPSIDWDGESPVLVVVGGWGSALLPEVVRLARERVVTEMSVAPGGDGSGPVFVRIAAAVMDPEMLAAYGATPR